MPFTAIASRLPERTPSSRAMVGPKTRIFDLGHHVAVPSFKIGCFLGREASCEGKLACMRVRVPVSATRPPKREAYDRLGTAHKCGSVLRAQKSHADSGRASEDVMEVATIVTAVIGVLLLYLKKGATEFVQVAGEVGYEKTKGLLATLKKRWLGDPSASDVLTKFETKPEAFKEAVEAVLTEKLASDETLRAELTAHLREMGPTLEVVQNLKGVDIAVGIDVEQFDSGRARVTQDAADSKNVTGIRIRRT